MGFKIRTSKPHELIIYIGPISLLISSVAALYFKVLKDLSSKFEISFKTVTARFYKSISTNWMIYVRLRLVLPFLSLSFASYATLGKLSSDIQALLKPRLPRLLFLPNLHVDRTADVVSLTFCLQTRSYLFTLIILF